MNSFMSKVSINISKSVYFSNGRDDNYRPQREDVGLS